MHIEKCGYCGKHVAEKPFLGTLHICRTPAERAAIDYGRWQIEQQRKIIESGASLYFRQGLSA